MNVRGHALGTRFAVVLASLAMLVSGSPVDAQRKNAQDAPAKVTFADGRVTYEPPAGFTALSAEWLATKYPRAGAPRQAVGNTRRTTSIAYDLLDQKAPSTDLDALRKALMESFAALPKLQWVATDVRRIGNREFAYIEFTAAAADQDIHNIVLLGVVDGRLLMFNFNSTVQEFPSVEKALRASMATITIKPESKSGL